MRETEHICVGVLIPTYRHAQSIEKVVSGALEYLPRVLVVVDGGGDDTMERLEGLSISVLHFPRNLGKGAALKAGFREAARLGWTHAITMDSDGQHKAQNIPDFVRAIRLKPEAIILGDRDMDAPQVPSSSKFGKNFTNFWIWVETGHRVADGQSGFRAYPLARVNALSTWFNRYEFEVEVLTRSLWKWTEVTSIPVLVDYKPEGGRISHFRPFLDNLRTSWLNTILCTTRVLQIVLVFPIVLQKKGRKW